MLHGRGPASVVHVVVGTGTPSCPLSPRPQQYAAPLGVRAQVWAPPAATDSNVTTETETSTVPLFPSEVAVMVVVPSPTPLTTPVAETVATEGSVVVQDTERPRSGLPDSSWGVALNCCDAPTRSVNSLGET